MNHISVFTGIYLKLLPESTNTGWLKETFVLIVGKVIAPDSFLKSSRRTPALEKKKSGRQQKVHIKINENKQIILSGLRVKAKTEIN